MTNKMDQNKKLSLPELAIGFFSDHPRAISKTGPLKMKIKKPQLKRANLAEITARFTSDGEILLISSDYEKLSIRVTEENEELCQMLFELILDSQ